MLCGFLVLYTDWQATPSYFQQYLLKAMDQTGFCSGSCFLLGTFLATLSLPPGLAVSKN